MSEAARRACCVALDGALLVLAKQGGARDVLSVDWLLHEESKLARIVQGLSGTLGAGALERVRRAIRAWSPATDRQALTLSGIVERALAGLGVAFSRFLRPRLQGQAQAIVRRVKLATRRRYALRPSAAFVGASDQTAAQFLAQSHALFVRDTVGQVSATLAARAQAVAARGVQQGLGVEGIQRELMEKVPGFMSRAPYARLVANAFVNRTRTYAALATYRDAQILRYQILAVLDERTTETCAMLDGTTFEVGGAMRLFDRAEEAPLGDQRFVLPFLRESGPKEDRRIVMGTRAGGERTVARILESRAREPDAKGRYDLRLSEAALASNGIAFPPFHHACRTTVIPIV